VREITKHNETIFGVLQIFHAKSVRLSFGDLSKLPLYSVFVWSVTISKKQTNIKSE